MNQFTPIRALQRADSFNELLVVEDSRTFSRIIERGVTDSTGIRCTTVGSLREARRLIEESPHRWGMALVDLCMPDATNGEAAIFMVEAEIPTIIFTGNFDEDVRTKYLDMGVLDFVLKDSPSSLEYIARLARRVFSNRNTTVLVVDDSTVARRICSDYLRRYCLEVLEAASAKSAMKLLRDRPDISLVITDHEMPGKSGFELVREIRETRSSESLAIIGVSGTSSRTLSAKFLKYGANDFISKPFVAEELYTRVAMNLDIQENLGNLKWAATHDSMTGIYNRRAFFDYGRKLVAVRSRTDQAFAVALLDIDHFKQINDTHGHDGGDKVLQAVARCIEEHASREDDLCARYGGEEFAILAGVNNPDRVRAYFEALRTKISEIEVRHLGNRIRVTASIGVATGSSTDLHMMISAADKNLYEAKRNGRDQVCNDKLKLNRHR